MTTRVGRDADGASLVVSEPGHRPVKREAVEARQELPQYEASFSFFLFLPFDQKL